MSSTFCLRQNTLPIDELVLRPLSCPPDLRFVYELVRTDTSCTGHQSNSILRRFSGSSTRQVHPADAGERGSQSPGLFGLADKLRGIQTPAMLKSRFLGDSLKYRREHNKPTRVKKREYPLVVSRDAKTIELHSQGTAILLGTPEFRDVRDIQRTTPFSSHAKSSNLLQTEQNRRETTTTRKREERTDVVVRELKFNQKASQESGDASFDY